MTHPLKNRDDYLALPHVKADRRCRYGDDPAQFVDLYWPQQALSGGERLPVVLLLHGGCWSAGYGLEPLGQLARALADEGLVVVNVEYRLLGAGGGWPMTFQDVAAAADLLPTLAADLPLDLQRVIAVGHSAGGHLALWLACRRHFSAEAPVGYAPNPLPLAGVVSLAGIPDMTEAVARGICGKAPETLLAGLPNAVPEHYRFGSPSAWLPLGVPHVHLVGDLDAIVPLDYVADCVAQAQAAGDASQLRVLHGAGHFEPAFACGQAWLQLCDLLDQLSVDS